MKLNAPANSNRSVVLVIAFALTAIAAAFWAGRASQTALPQTNSVIGQVATQGVFAPRKITVIDSAATEARRQSELGKVPEIFRFKQSAVDEAVVNFNTDFVAAREEFLDTVEKSFNKRKLSTNQLAGPRFRELFTAFKTTHKTFPVTIGQALKWAQGNEQLGLQAQFRERLRSAAGKLIFSDDLPTSARSGPVRILNAELTGSPSELFARSQALRRTNLVALSKARKGLAASFRSHERVISDVLTNFLQVNCVFDEALTTQMRAEKTNAIWAFATYQPGQVIVQRGQIIDVKTKAALDEIGAPGAIIEKFSRRQMLLWAVAISCTVLALIIGLQIIFGRRNTSLVPVGNVLTLPTNEPQNLQAQLMPHLARGLMNKLVRRLISQRAELIQTQNSGAEELNELEQRLEQINTRLQTRQAAYEQRISDLEKELAAAEEENRELIRAKIHEARQNLEWAKAQKS